MILYSTCSILLGWMSIPRLSEHSLALRSIEMHASKLLGFLCALICCIGACCSWILFPPAACIAFSLGCACMAALLICDLDSHTLPTELVALLLVFAVVFRLSLGTVSEMLSIAGPACAVASLLVLGNLTCKRMGKPDLIGMGDIRMIIPLALFSGLSGAACGFMACAIVMGAIALAEMLFRHSSFSSYIAMAPGFVAWLFIGTLAPFIVI